MKVLARGLVAVLSVLMLGIVAAGVGFLAVQKRHLRTELESRLLAIAQLKVSQIVQWRAERLAEATVQAESPFMSSAVDRWMESPTPELTESLRSRLSSFQRHYQYREALLTDLDGKVRLNARWSGILFTIVDRRIRATREMTELIRDFYGPEVFDTEIPTNARLGEAPRYGVDIFRHDPSSPGALAYRALAGEFLERLERLQG